MAAAATPARFDIFLQDPDRFRREARGLLDPGRPLFLFGHSLGGLIVLRYLQEFDPSIDGAALSSPWLAPDAPLTLRGRVLAATLGRVLPAIRLPLRLDVGRRDAPGDAASARQEDDPLVHTAATPRLVRELRAAAALARGRAGRVRAPLLILPGEEDSLVGAAASLELARSPGDARALLRCYPGRGHELGPSGGSGGELSDLVAWLDARVGALAAGMAGKGGIRLAPPLRTHQPGAGA